MAEIPRLRPLSVGEILDVGIKLYLRHWRTLMLCVVGILLPVQILVSLVLLSVDPSSLSYDFSNSSSNADVEWGGIAALFIVEIVAVLSWLLATAACFKAVSDAYLGSTPEPGRSLRFGLRRLPALFGMVLIAGIALTLALLALVVPFFWLGVSWVLGVPALLFERLGPAGALTRSFRLVRRRWWPTFGTFLVGYFLVTIIAAIVQAVPTLIGNAIAPDSNAADAVASIVGGTIGSVISVPYLAAIVTLMYFDQRVRKEGFDLQLLAEGLGRERDPDAPLPEPLVGPDVTPEQRAAAPFWPPPPGWVPPPAEPAPAPAANREWWRDPVPGPSGTGAFAPPRPEDSSGAEASPEAERDESPPKPDPDRADWLPPEAPRGPGGL